MWQDKPRPVLGLCVYVRIVPHLDLFGPSKMAFGAWGDFRNVVVNVGDYMTSSIKNDASSRIWSALGTKRPPNARIEYITVLFCSSLQ
jgi:hypothetical protein